MSEHDEQVAVVKWFKLQYPKYKDCIMSIPNGSVINNGGKRGCGRLKWMISEGFKTGVSDLFIAVPAGGYAGLWVEMKDKKKTYCSVSKPQREHIELMNNVGYSAHWAPGFNAAKLIIDEYMHAIDN